jgi:hypothetical protein
LFLGLEAGAAEKLALAALAVEIFPARKGATRSRGKSWTSPLG